MNEPNDYDRLLVPISEREHVRGNIDASTKLLEYGDYQCSDCGYLHRTLLTIGQQLDENFCFVFRHFPQTQIHPQAQRAAEAAESAAAQGKFWQMHDTLFEHQHALEDSHLVEYANDLGLDIPQFLRDLSEHIYVNRINEDIKSGRNNHVISIPTLFINGDRYLGAWDLESLLTVV
ncbi:MAG: DsbA family protein [Chroococcidiopsis sp.]